MDSITINLTLEELMKLPGEAVITLLDKANASPELLAAARDYESRPGHGKGRWVILNQIRNRLNTGNPTANH